MDVFLTERIRKMAYDSGADLVGFANVERFKDAPLEASPQGLMPGARSVVVIGIHHPDAVVENSGYPTPREVKSYYIQTVLNEKMESILFKLARFLEKEGYASLFTNGTNSQKYRASDSSGSIFLAEISHRHAAAAAGLGEFGWSGLLLTPEYGPRVRFLTLVTEAELEPTPLYDGPSLCDRCGECVRHCPSKAFSAEVNGAVRIKIEDKVFEYANKNLWRCAWAEHFAIDLNRRLPERIDENVLVEEFVKSGGSTGGSLGQCLKYCMPRSLRYDDPAYAGSRRKTHVTANTEIPPHRSIVGKIRGALASNNIDNIYVLDEALLREKGVDVRQYLPDGKSAIVFSASCCVCEAKVLEGYDTAERLERTNRDNSGTVRRSVEIAMLETAQILEAYGFTGLTLWEEARGQFARLVKSETAHLDMEGVNEIWGVVLTSLPAERLLNRGGAGANPGDGFKAVNMEMVYEIAGKQDGNLIGVCSASRADAAVQQLAAFYEGDGIVTSDPIGKGLFGSYQPAVRTVKRKVLKPSDYIPYAKSVITIGVHYPDALINSLEKNYMLATLISDHTLKQAGFAAWKTASYLRSKGYKAVVAFDLFNTASYIISIKGEQHDALANDLLVPLSGIGGIARNGVPVTPGYGVAQRFAAVITDAVLEQNAVFDGSSVTGKCSGCRKCIQSCPTGALKEEDAIKLRIEGVDIEYMKVNQLKCDWAKRYGLAGADGAKSSGMRTEVLPSENPDEAEFTRALEQLDPLQRIYVGIGESCILNCPYVCGQG